MQPSGYSSVKRALIAALRSGNYQHAVRNDIDEKNLLATGVVSAAEVIHCVTRSHGGQYSCSPLHGSVNIPCRLIRSHGWYIKFYFIEPDTYFISVHQ